MRVLVVGGGGREHALVWKISQSPLVDDVIAAPGNAGIAELAATFPVSADDMDGLVRLGQEQEVDLTVVGPELPLTLGITDRFAEAGLLVFGPSGKAARLEGSKWFAKELMLKYGIPTGRAWLCNEPDEAVGRAGELGYPVVVKANGLAAGKGVVVANDEVQARRAVEDAMVKRRFGDAGASVLIEEHLVGEEASILAFTDGERVAYMLPSQDHKRALDGGAGSNTGGMGAYAPAGIVTPEITHAVRHGIVEAAVAAMSEEGCPYRGVIYAGLMITEHGPMVIEFNCRFGDPEVQATIPLLSCDIVEVMLAAARGELDPDAVRSADGAAACVVMASGGYPGPYEKGKEIRGLEAAGGINGVIVFHAGTAVREDRIVTAGGRVLGVTGIAEELPSALDRAYRGVHAIRFEGAHYRTDIGWRALLHSAAGACRPEGW